MNGKTMAQQRKKANEDMKTFSGLSINPGKVLAPVCLYSAERHRNVTEMTLASPKQIGQELARFDDALMTCSKELDKITADVTTSIGQAEAEIFITQKHILNDPAMLEKVRLVISGERKNVEYAVHRVLGDYEHQFEKIDNEYLRERATDIGEIRRRLLNHLFNLRPGFVCEGQHTCSKGENRIIVAEELTPDMIVHMNLEKVRGFVTEHGGISSHAAIIARSLGIPAVSGVRDILDFVKCGNRLLIDGNEGKVFLNPDAATVAAIIPVAPVITDSVCLLESPPGIEILANASMLEEVRLARSVNADGIGLLRTEIFFLSLNRIPSEEEQFGYYVKIIEMMEGKPVTFRMLDVGGDKPLPFLRIEKEQNPYLGWRGARFLLSNPDIFGMQVRALARASAVAPIKVMFPMVIDAQQMALLNREFREHADSVRADQSAIRIGAMFEVPSAVLAAREIFDHIDFGSIGSNDLIQYTFAVDRNNERVSGEYNPEHPLLWSILRQLGVISRQTGKPLSICGEMAGRDGTANRLIDIGIPSISVSPRLIPRVRNEVANRDKLKAGTA